MTPVIVWVIGANANSVSGEFDEGADSSDLTPSKLT